MSVEKVLFLGDPNHGIDTFFHGLCEVFGDTNVYQFPIEKDGKFVVSFGLNDEKTGIIKI